ncbi:unnamed protein product, partial [Heligmosomoides polygyrus]|uniref:CCDC66 domain-containing protein n=1 Tax=Heligmosomoides polygyrus TaxID=6339 RepID=A0A183GR54_HELPZ
TEEGCVERDRLEEDKAKREQEQDARRHEEEERKQKEEELSKEQEKERRRKALEEALERAKHEAEITRKARVFKHVLEGADKSPELERRLLGVDPETGDRILHEITQMERQKKLEREVLDRKPPTRRADEHRENSPVDKRSRSAQPKSRTSSISESYATMEIRDDRAKSPSGRKQTASIRPFNSADDRVVRSAYEPPVNRVPPPPPAAQSTPMRRMVPGRMSVRVTRKEKENTAVDDGFSRGPTRATM